MSAEFDSRQASAPEPEEGKNDRAGRARSDFAIRREILQKLGDRLEVNRPLEEDVDGLE